MSSWVAFHRSQEAEDLQTKHPNAFLLLAQVARRARWSPCSITGLEPGQAFIGDWRKAGIPSEKSYRVAKEVLTRCNFAAFKGASNGTIATLLDSKVFSLSESNEGGQKGGQGASEGRTRGGQGASNIQGYKENTDTKTPVDEDEESSSPLDFEKSTQATNNPIPPKFPEVEAFAKSQPFGISDECIGAFFDEMEALQWTYKGFPCIAKAAWHARFRKWATNWANNEAGRRPAR